MKPLFLHQEIMLLALRDQEGTTVGAMYNYDYAIAGAVMSELLIQKRIEVTADKKQWVTLAVDAGLLSYNFDKDRLKHRFDPGDEKWGPRIERITRI